MTLMTDDPRQPYMQAADALRSDIEDGRLAAGQRLPSIRKLADRFGIAPMTVQSALRVLREEGRIYSVTNRGFFVQGDAEESSTAGLATQVEQLSKQVQDLTARVSALEGDGSEAEFSHASNDR